MRICRSPDWSLWRSFAAVVAEGSLSAAARKLGLSQPTLGRHVEALEQDLGVTLFERTLAGLKPTDTALQLYEPVAQAERALAEAAIVAEGTTGDARAARCASPRDTSPRTTSCRRSSPTSAASFPRSPSSSCPRTRSRTCCCASPTSPSACSGRPSSSWSRESSARFPIVACAHESYLARRGTPLAPDELASHDLIGFDRSDLMISGAKAMGFDAHARRLRRPHRQPDRDVGADEGGARHRLCAGGAGRATRPACGRSCPMLRPPPLEVWLTTHRELFTSRRIRAIYDRLAEGLLSYLGRRGQPGERHLDGIDPQHPHHPRRRAPWR